MLPNPPTYRAVAASALLICSLCLAAQKRDTVIYTDGRADQVYVLKEGLDSIEFSLDPEGKTRATKRLEEIREIIYADQPPEYVLAMNALGRGDLRKAISDLEKAAKAKGRAWVPRYCWYYIAECLSLVVQRDRTQLPNLEAAYGKLLQVGAGTRFEAEAHLGLGVCHLRAEKLSSAKAALQKVVQGNYGALWGQRARSWLARVLEAQGAYDAARKEYVALTQAGVRDDLLLVMITTHLGKCQAKLGSHGAARKTLEDALQKAQMVEARLGSRSARSYRGVKAYSIADAARRAQANAHLGLGDCWLAAGDHEEALLEYLFVDFLAPEAREIAAEALYQAAHCFLKLGKKERATSLLRETGRRFSDVSWGRKATLEHAKLSR